MVPAVLVTSTALTNNEIEDSVPVSRRTARSNLYQGEDRRADRRYPIVVEVEYRLAKSGKILQKGQGRTLNVSSGGILFESASVVPPGMEIEVSLEWPAMLDNVTALRLSIVGRTVWARDNQTALRILRYDFRIRGNKKAPTEKQNLQ
jgi:PilZ domain-containing protein